MPKRIAIDWDDSELRLVAANCSGSSVRVTDAAVIPIEERGVLETLRAALERRGLEKLEVLVAIGRGKAELRELKLPPVPDNELPDMVRFQAIRSFASAGESAAVDYLVTHRSEENVSLIAAAIGPSKLEGIKKTCEKAGVSLKRIALRPLSAAALYLSRNTSETGETVLIDLLADDAEIVISRNSDVVFVRTVKLPSDPAARPSAIAGELRRSLVACGSTDASRRILLWGRDAVHRDDVEMIAEAIGGEVTTLDPFKLVDVERKASDELPEHVGRLAPLVGLLVCDDSQPGRLIDFLNPRKRAEETSNRSKVAILTAVAVVLIGLVGWFGYQQLAQLDRQIAQLESQNASLKPLADSANQSVQRTEKVDQFLDGNVNWLAEFQRIAAKIPPSDELIVTNINARSGSRTVGVAGATGADSTIKIDGYVTEAGIIAVMEDALRDEHHRVTVEGSEEQETDDAYAWSFGETITIDSNQVRVARYQGIADLNQTASETDQDDQQSSGGAEVKTKSDGESSETKDEADAEATPDNSDMPDGSESSPEDEAPLIEASTPEDSANGTTADVAVTTKPEVQQ